MEEIKEILEDVKRHLDYVNDSGLKSIRDTEMEKMYDYITNLQQENERLKEVVENLTTMTANGDTKQIKNTAQYKLEQLENNRDKAIEVIDLITPELWNISNKMTYRLKDIKYILKGDSDGFI